MTENQIKRLSSETGEVEAYRLVQVEEEVSVKGDSFKALHEYYERLSDKELFEPFDEPDKNLVKDYAFYRRRHHLLSPDKIREVRNSYQLSVRDFSTILGISFGNLSAIENGAIQSKYIDSLLRLASSPHAFRELAASRQGDITHEKYEQLMQLLDALLFEPAKDIEQIAEDFEPYE